MVGLHDNWQVYFFISCWLLLVNPREFIVILEIMRVQYSSNLGLVFLKSPYSIYFGMIASALLKRSLIFLMGNPLENRQGLFFRFLRIPLAKPNYLNLIPNSRFFSAGGVDLPIDALRGDGLAGLSRSQSGGVGGARVCG